jgi:hypothetical protein
VSISNGVVGNSHAVFLWAVLLKLVASRACEGSGGLQFNEAHKKADSMPSAWKFI